MSHPEEHEFDLYALGSLEGDERRALEEHLAGCPDCRQRLEAAQERVNLVALASPWREPPRDAREKLLRRIRAEAGSAPATARSEGRGNWLWKQPATAWALAALILTVAATLLVRENRRLEQELAALKAAAQEQQAAAEHARKVLEVLTAPDTQRVALVSAEQRPQPHGGVFYNSRKGLIFYAANLPMPPADRAYQLWLVPMDGQPVSAGVFMPDAHGNAEVMMPPLPPDMPAKAFAVTVEPSGGMPQPTGPKVLIGAAS